MHPDEEWDSGMVFKVPYGDWLGGILPTFYDENGIWADNVADEDLKATAAATCPEEWVRMRFPEWTNEEVKAYLKEHKPYVGDGREDRVR